VEETELAQEEEDKEEEKKEQNGMSKFKKILNVNVF